MQFAILFVGYRVLIGNEGSTHLFDGSMLSTNVNPQSPPLDTEKWLEGFCWDQEFFSKEESWSTPTDQPCRKPSNEDPPLPQLVPISRWRSQARSISAHNITLVTQLTLGRMDTLTVQCEHWSNALAAVVYVPFAIGSGIVSKESESANFSSVQSVVEQLDRYHKAMEEKAKLGETCALDLELVMESFESIHDEKTGKHPINALRNRAVLLSRSEVLLLMDVDMVPGRLASFHRLHRNEPEDPYDLFNEVSSGKVFVVRNIVRLDCGVFVLLKKKKDTCSFCVGGTRPFAAV